MKLYINNSQRKEKFMTVREISEVFAPFLQAWNDFFDREGNLAFLNDAEYEKMYADYHYYDRLCLAIGLRNSKQTKTEQEPVLLPLFCRDDDEEADICIKKKHSQEIEME